MNKKQAIVCRLFFVAGAVMFMAVLFWLLWREVPAAAVRRRILAVFGGVTLLAALWARYQRWQGSRFADELCQTLDALIAGREPEQYHPYEDSLTSKVQGKLMQYYDIMHEGRRQSEKDKQIIQELVSDISHQVRTPVSNIRMFTGILQQHHLPEEKKAEFLELMEGQVDKLDFLMQSLIRMSRLETGTFVLNIEKARLTDTIARAVSVVWAKAECRNIEISVECEDHVTAQHDPKWTAEALFNLLDNAVKYTPDGGSVTVSVSPWQFYTRIDVRDTGMGIPECHYHDVFKRFFRAQEAAGKEGVGLGLYLANGIIMRQRGYICVKSKEGEGSVFSVYLLT